MGAPIDALHEVVIGDVVSRRGGRLQVMVVREVRPRGPASRGSTQVRESRTHAEGVGVRTGELRRSRLTGLNGLLVAEPAPHQVQYRKAAVHLRWLDWIVSEGGWGSLCAVNWSL